MGMLTNYLENKLVDLIFRGQAYTLPSTLHVGLLTAAPADTAGGTEVTGGAYARVAVASTLAKWAGTHAAASTDASSGTSGTTSNNDPITFPTPTANWGQATHFAIWDSASGGNMMFYGALTQPKTINLGDPAPLFPAGTLSLQLDN